VAAALKMCPRLTEMGLRAGLACAVSIDDVRTWNVNAVQASAPWQTAF